MGSMQLGHSAPATELPQDVEQSAERENGSEETGQNASRNGLEGMLITELARLSDRTILNVKRLAGILSVTPRTVHRMVRRNELPPSVRFGGNAVWMAGRVLAHIEAAADRAKLEADRQAERIRRLSP